MCDEGLEFDGVECVAEILPDFEPPRKECENGRLRKIDDHQFCVCDENATFDHTSGVCVSAGTCTLGFKKYDWSGAKCIC